MSAVMERSFSAAEVCRTTGISYRQLDYWCRIGVVHPGAGQGSGSWRQFSEDDLWRLRMTALLLIDGRRGSKGLQIGEIRSLLDGHVSTGRLREYAHALVTVANEIDARSA